jgi:diguanylate cyclase (GGDEF)-like protein/PAS domain S-box-containing protein
MKTIPGSMSDAATLHHYAVANRKEERNYIAPDMENPHHFPQKMHARQIELELENESLRKSIAEMEIVKNRLTDFYDFADAGFFTLTRDGFIVETNFAGASLVGLDRVRLAGRNFMHFVAPEKRTAFTSMLTRIYEDSSKQWCETVLLKNLGASQVLVHVSAFTRESGQECHLVVNDITERSHMEQALHEKDYLLSESQRIAGIGSWSLAAKDDFVRWTDETYRIYGVTPDTFVPTVRNWISLIYSKDQPAMKEWIRACLAGELPEALEFRVARPDRSIRVLEGRGNLQYAPDGTPLRIIGSVQDITERKRIENELVESEALFRTITENVGDLIAMLDADGQRLYVNPSYRRIFVNEESMIGSSSFVEIHPEDSDRIRDVFRRTVETGIGERAEYRFLLSDGNVRHIESEGNVVCDEDGRVCKVILVSRDVTERKQTEEQIQHLANYDNLTDLPNRRLFTDRLQQALASAKRDKSRLAVLFLDLDMFKQINDRLGHDIGDQLLKDTAKRLQDCLRETDSAARVGGDEFLVVLPGIESAKDALVAAEKIRDALEQPFEFAGHSLKVSSSIGVAIYPENGGDDKELIKNADDAMYVAKASGRNAVKLFQAVN